MLDDTLKLAFKLIYRVMYEGAYSSVIPYALENDKSLSRSQKNYIFALSYGVIENWLLLNHYIDRIAKKRIKPNLRVLIASALYEIEFMENNADHITVNSYVNYAKKNIPHAKGFVNAILRNHLRGEKLKSPQTLDEYAIFYSHPLELAKLWSDAYGEEKAIEIMKANQTKAPISVRLNSKLFTPENLKTSLLKDGIDVRESEYSKKAFLIDSLGGKSIESLDAFKKGMFYIQDISSILLIDALKIKGDEKVLDLCSAPGGKGLGILERLVSGRITLCDVSEKKLKLIIDNIKRLKLDSDLIENIIINDASSYNDKFSEAFDIVLADVPCSGLGIIRKKPEIKYLKEIKKLKSMLKLQGMILEQASKYVKVGGVLVYSTCTMNPAENEDIIKGFLKKHADYTVERFETDNVKGNPNMNFLTSDGYSDGFFVSTIRRS